MPQPTCRFSKAAPFVRARKRQHKDDLERVATMTLQLLDCALWRFALLGPHWYGASVSVWETELPFLFFERKHSREKWQEASRAFWFGPMKVSQSTWERRVLGASGTPSNQRNHLCKTTKWPAVALFNDAVYQCFALRKEPWLHCVYLFWYFFSFFLFLLRNKFSFINLFVQEPIRCLQTRRRFTLQWSRLVTVV